MTRLTIAFCLLALLVLASSCALAGEPAPETQARLDEISQLTSGYLWQLDDYYWHQGQYERCIAILRMIAEVDPHDTEAYSSGAWLLQNQLRDDEAEVLLLRGLELNPDVYDLYYDLGLFYYMHERFDEAIPYIESAVRYPVHKAVWHLLAHCYEHVGDLSQAANIWADRQQMEPGDVVPAIQLDRIMRGGKPSGGPAMASRAREERMREKELRSH